MIKTAKISEDGKFRYYLTRDWSGLFPTKAVMFIGLNPSTADHEIDDPTIRRCIGFASTWGYNKLIMTNPFAYRTKSPKELYERWKLIKNNYTYAEDIFQGRQQYLDEIIGPENDKYILQGYKEALITIAAWGSEGQKYKSRINEITNMLGPLACLGGSPRHPLYTRKDIKIEPFTKFEKHYKEYGPDYGVIKI